MAKSNSFHKKEVEKNKQQKKKEKLQRKEERKQQGVSSFEDMIAYVDINGVIVDEPPVPTKAEEIELEDIEVSVPSQGSRRRGGRPHRTG